MLLNELLTRIGAWEARREAYQRWRKRGQEFADRVGLHPSLAARAANVLAEFGEEAETASERDLVRLPGCGPITARFIQRMLHEG